MKEREYKKPRHYREGRASITEQGEYRHYLRLVSKREDRFKNRTDFLIFMRAYFQEMRDAVIESHGGVLFDDVFYLYVFMLPKKRMTDLIGRNKRVYFATELYHYFPASLFKSRFSYWTFDKTFTPSLKNGVINKLKAGKHYRQYVATLQKMKKL